MHKYIIVNEHFQKFYFGFNKEIILNLASVTMLATKFIDIKFDSKTEAVESYAGLNVVIFNYKALRPSILSREKRKNFVLQKLSL